MAKIIRQVNKYLSFKSLFAPKIDSVFTERYTTFTAPKKYIDNSYILWYTYMYDKIL